MKLSIAESVLGCSINLKNIYGVKLKLDTTPYLNDGDQYRFENRGIKSPRSTFVGDHIVQCKIEIPNKLT